MAEASFVIEYEELKYVFTGTRNEVSGKYTETIAVHMRKHPVYEFDIAEFIVNPHLGSYDDIIRSIKGAHRKLLKMDIILSTLYYHHHLGVMLGRFKRSRPWRKTIQDEKFFPYCRALRFPYEGNPRIKVKQDKISLELYRPGIRKDQVTVTFNKLPNRRYQVSGAIVFEQTTINVKSYSYVREMGVDNVAVLTKQLIQWLDTVHANLDHVPRFNDIRNGGLEVLQLMEKDIVMIIDRLNKGWEI